MTQRDANGRFVRTGGATTTSAGGRVVDRDCGAGALRDRVRRLAHRVSVKVGILDDAPKEVRGGGASDVTLVEVAYMNELGAPEANVPQRSFIGATVDAQERAIRDGLRASAGEVILGDSDVVVALDEIGEDAHGRIVARMRAGIEPENAPATIERKGSDTPLIDTSQMIDALTWRRGQ